MSEVLNAVLLTEVFVTLFVIMDPPGTIPVFLSLTAGRSAATMRRAAWQAVAVSFLVITIFAFFGHQILRYMHISIPALQCAGGLLLLLIALELLTGNEKDPVASQDANIAMVPLGTPLLAGPGAIVATMLFVEQIDSVADVTAVSIGVILVHLCICYADTVVMPNQGGRRSVGVALWSA
ncbi:MULTISPECIES: MarC family protein [unclassified Nocardioides]|uniref:MarC family protein n=1 Tax=unclassified Nocardioides TaxID=2615069 RepID=UPI0009ECA9A7|nr:MULTISPECIES: MarC family protein [unclassified Nocardioides]